MVHLLAGLVFEMTRYRAQEWRVLFPFGAGGSALG
jgi:hypothetical protein